RAPRPGIGARTPNLRLCHRIFAPTAPAAYSNDCPPQAGRPQPAAVPERRVMHKLAIAFGLLLPVPLLAGDRTPGPMPAEKAAKAMTLPDGFRATVFAAEPDIVQPISFCLDTRGRLFVAEALNYGTWQATGKDRIVILEDAKGEGRADKRTVFYE